MIVSSEVVQYFFEKDVECLKKSKQKKKKKVPMKYKCIHILLNFCHEASDLLEIKFPAEFTSKIGLIYFFQIPGPPCMEGLPPPHHV